MKTIKNNWKVALIVAVGIITIILLGVEIKHDSIL